MDRSALFTATPVARKIASAQGVDPEPILRSLRKLMAAGLIEPSLVPQGGSTAPNLFNEADTYRAAVVFRLIRLGLSEETVRAALQYLNHFEGEQSADDCLWTILDDLKKRPYFFHLYVVPDYFTKPGDVQFGTFSAERDGGIPHPSGADAWITTITVPLRGLVPDPNQSDEPLDLPPPPAVNPKDE